MKNRNFYSLAIPIFAFGFTFSTYLSSVAQGNIVTLRIAEPVYNTLKLNINGVAVKSVILISDSTTLTHAFVGERYEGQKLINKEKRSNEFRDWLRKDCGLLNLTGPREIVPTLKRHHQIIYKPKFVIESGKIYLIIEVVKDFLHAYQSFALQRIPPPTIPPNTSNEDFIDYKHVEFCKPDGCVSLCVTKAVASFEVCCNGFCFNISYDGELDLSTSVSLK